MYCWDRLNMLILVSLKNTVTMRQQFLNGSGGCKHTPQLKTTKVKLEDTRRNQTHGNQLEKTSQHNHDSLENREQLQTR